MHSRALSVQSHPEPAHIWVAETAALCNTVAYVSTVKIIPSMCRPQCYLSPDQMCAACVHSTRPVMMARNLPHLHQHYHQARYACSRPTQTQQTTMAHAHTAVCSPGAKGAYLRSKAQLDKSTSIQHLFQKLLEAEGAFGRHSPLACSSQAGRMHDGCPNPVVLKARHGIPQSSSTHTYAHERKRARQRTIHATRPKVEQYRICAKTHPSKCKRVQLAVSQHTDCAEQAPRA